MSKKIIACLGGEWVNLCDDPDCIMGVHRTSPHIWYENNADIFSPKTKTTADTYYYLDYINIHYKGIDWRINPIYIQIATTE